MAQGQSRQSIRQCRNLLNSENELTDKEIQGIRDDLYVLADLAIDAFLTRKQEGRGGAGSGEPVRIDSDGRTVRGEASDGENGGEDL